jgi:4-hydroxyphenylacetate 3-monooxygenase/4-hydroxybutyryl-CoA dehydratase/vinylacetyl-CoA-Delta-isomerase
VVEKNADGIVVRGAKNHITISPYADEIIVVPTRALTKEDAQWAVSFAVPADDPQVLLVNRTTSPRPRNLLKAPIAEIGWSDSFVIFDDTFIPWERVFMCGEWQAGGRLASLFATYHRHSYCGCKPATTDVIMGATALVADYNGVGSAPHIREELADLIAVAELVFSAGVAASVTGKPSSSGTYIPDIVYTNVGRYHAGINIYHEHETLAAIAGGLPATLPPEEEFFSTETGELMNKYIQRKPGVSSESQHRLFRMIGDLIASSFGGCNQFAGIHGGGSPIMEKIAIRTQYDLESKKKLAKYLAGIVEDETPQGNGAKAAATTKK